MNKEDAMSQNGLIQEISEFVQKGRAKNVKELVGQALDEAWSQS